MNTILLRASFFVVALSSLCTVTNAQDKYSGGSGTSSDPYQIATTDDLIELSNTPSDWSSIKYFIQTADIEFPEDSSLFNWDGEDSLEWNGNGTGDDEKGFKPIGVFGSEFDAIYDGQHFTIYNLFINRPSDDDVGLFGYAQLSFLRDTNLPGILNVRLKNARIKGDNYTGCIVGFMYTPDNKIRNSSCSGTVEGTNYVGGLIGQTQEPISRSTFFGNIIASDDYHGGIIGQSDYSNNSDIYSISVINGSNYVGGLVGATDGSVFNRTYSVSSVTANFLPGGLFGFASNSTISNSFWSEQFAGVSSSGGGTNTPPELMNDASTYSAFDFDGTSPGDDYYWVRDESIQGGLPYLWFEDVTHTVDLINTTNSSSITKGQSNEVICSFSLQSTGEAKDDVTFFLGRFPLSGSRSGYSNFKLWKSSDNSFSSSSDTQLGSTVAVDPGETDTLYFGPFLDELNASSSYYFVTADVASGATGSINLAINSKSIWVKHARVAALDFFRDDNGVTIKCPGVAVDSTFVLGGVTYTRRAKGDITPDNAQTTCTTGITDMSSLFKSKSFNGDISHWDVSSVTTMRDMFAGTSSFTHPFNQDIGDWDVSSVTDLGRMFQYSSFNQDIGDWDVSNVTNMNATFQFASNFNQDLSGWVTSKVTNMYALFHYTNFNQDISSWDVSKVTNMSRMFGYSPFNQDISGWNVSRANFLSEMFEGNTAFNQDIGGWTLNTGQLTAREMFNGATSFNQDISDWNLSGSRYSSDFNDIAKNSGIDSLNSSIIIAEWWQDGYDNVDWHPDYDEDLVAYGEYGVIDTAQLASRKWTLSGSRVDVDRPGEDFYLASNGVTIRCEKANNGDTGTINSVTYTKRTNKADITPANAATTCTSGLTSTSELFEGENNITNVSHWDVSSVLSMRSMFQSSTDFNQDLSEWDVSNVTDMHSMFYSATSFNTDISGWDVSSVTHMEEMFNSATSFNKDISSWDVSGLNYARRMFRGASNFNQDLSSWRLSSLLSISNDMVSESGISD